MTLRCDQVAPVLQIPCEITSEIFRYCLPEDEFPQPSIRSAPIQLSLVCSAWRELSIGTPCLWTKVLLCASTDFEDLSGTLTDHMESHVETLRLWTKRATPLLLSVHLRYPTLPRLDVPVIRIDQLPPIFHVIVENGARWKDIRLSLPRNYLDFGWSLTQQNASKLNSFAIDDTLIPIFGSSLAVSTGPINLQTGIAETLSTLSVCVPIIYAPPYRAPCMRLRKLSLKHAGPVECLNLLRHCPVLEDLILHFYRLNEMVGSSSGPTMLLPQLRTFHLSHTTYGEYWETSFPVGSEIGLLLECLSLPNLKGFFLWMTIVGRDIYNNPEIPWEYLSQLITRSNCSLTELELRTTRMTPSSMMKCLQLSPDLKYLGIPSDAELETEEVRQLLPSLQSLRLFSTDEVGESGQL
ncbi:hypothetical protein BD410DRAFT_845347 [Rickenella mellea]|uniref:Uncharacterized protein n=1 Tax=Rickenella mellea TaxID=50990 RepID=A0A4Y7PIF8_9AGAM|nr:hypothetical protein BD410DRAFT_845347 [Rickenella mellea]